METTYTGQAVDDGSTRMTLQNRGEPAGFSRLAAPLMAVAVRRANRRVRLAPFYGNALSMSVWARAARGARCSGVRVLGGRLKDCAANSLTRTGPTRKT